MSEINKPIDLDDYPLDVQVKVLSQLLDDATDNMRTLHTIFEKLYDSNEDIGLETMLLEGLAITGEYVSDEKGDDDE